MSSGRRWWVVIGAMIVVPIAFMALGATGRLSSDTAPAVTDLNDDGHLRVLVLGDSLVYNAIDELTAVLSTHGVEVEFRGYPNSGPLTDQTWWVDEMTEGVDTFAPDAVVVEACCNYDGSYHLSDGTTIAADTPAMYQTWAAKSREIAEIAASGGAAVFWVITPSTVPGADLHFPAERITRLNDIYRELGVDLIDWQAAITSGGESARSTHRDDGLHLNDLGDQLVAAATRNAIATSTD